MKHELPIPVTKLLNQIEGPEDGQWNMVLTSTWERLEKIAQRLLGKEFDANVLNSSELISEAWLRFSHHKPPKWENRLHFYNTMTYLMRQVLMRYAKQRKAQKRIPQNLLTSLDEANSIPISIDAEDLVYLDDLLEQFKQVDKRAFEIFTNRYFLNLKIKELSELYGVVDRTILRELDYARTWLQEALQKRHEVDYK